VDDLGTTRLRLERAGPIAWCTIDRPEARNALTPAMYFGIKRAVRLVNTDPDLAALILTGVGDVFAPGGELGGRSEAGESVPEGIGYDILPFLAVRDSGAPVISAVNGICQGGGLLIALLSDVAVVSERATFRAPEALRGIPDATYAAVLPAHVGMAVARDMLLTGRRLDAAEALRMGLVSRVVADDAVLAAALEIAAGMCEFSPYGLQMTKQVIWANLETASLAAAIELEDRNQIMLGMTDNLPEAITAFGEKRRPVYTDEPRRGLYPKD
jgi:enoyl-CoA hydratase/carnithine racemase